MGRDKQVRCNGALRRMRGLFLIIGIYTLSLFYWLGWQRYNSSQVHASWIGEGKLELHPVWSSAGAILQFWIWIMKWLLSFEHNTRVTYCTRLSKLNQYHCLYHVLRSSVSLLISCSVVLSITAYIMFCGPQYHCLYHVLWSSVSLLISCSVVLSITAYIMFCGPRYHCLYHVLWSSVSLLISCSVVLSITAYIMFCGPQYHCLYHVLRSSVSLLISCSVVLSITAYIMFCGPRYHCLYHVLWSSVSLLISCSVVLGITAYIMFCGPQYHCLYHVLWSSVSLLISCSVVLSITAYITFCAPQYHCLYHVLWSSVSLRHLYESMCVLWPLALNLNNIALFYWNHILVQRDKNSLLPMVHSIHCWSFYQICKDV